MYLTIIPFCSQHGHGPAPPSLLQGEAEKEARTDATHHRRTWSTVDLAVVDLMAASGVEAKVSNVRQFLAAHPNLQVSRTAVQVALKLRDVLAG